MTSTPKLFEPPLAWPRVGPIATHGDMTAGDEGDEGDQSTPDFSRTPLPIPLATRNTYGPKHPLHLLHPQQISGAETSGDELREHPPPGEEKYGPSSYQTDRFVLI
jgi:hypothetical protein